jgi:hypothetical protein
VINNITSNKDEIIRKYKSIIENAYSYSYRTERSFNTFLSKEDWIDIALFDENKIKFSKKDYYSMIRGISRYSVGYFYTAHSALFEDENKKLEKNSVNYDYLESRIKSSLYYDIGIYDRIAESSKGSQRSLAIKMCSKDTLVKLSKDKQAGVRFKAFERIGISALDEMLDDPICKIREYGVSIAPIDYPKLNDMTNELSYSVAIKLASKMQKSHLPFLLGNRNLKGNTTVSKIINKRLEA